MIVELLNEPPATAAKGGAERRRSRRHRVALPALLTPVATGASPVEVKVVDVSLHGAGLRCDGPVATDAEYVLDIGAGVLKLHTRVRVVNARLRKDGAWDVGVEFCAG